MKQAGRWGGRESPHLTGPTIAMDWNHPVAGREEADDINIESVWNLYRRPGTPGEKEAARQAIIRMTGTDPAYGETRQEPRRPAGPKRYAVTLRYTHQGREMSFETGGIEASDEIDAEYKARQQFREHWRLTVGGKVPETRATTRRA
jgi:hypothetical protein